MPVISFFLDNANLGFRMSLAMTETRSNAYRHMEYHS